jgi:hypothetical protein
MYEVIFDRNGAKAYVKNVQGGSDISGTLSKLYCRIKKSYFLLVISHKSFSALFRSGNIKKQTHSGKY